MKLFKNHTLNKIDEQNWKYYLKTLSGEISDIWDYIVITATNEKQKEHYEKEISKRQEEKKLPKKIKFLVISDFGGQRVGSGGATLNVLRYMEEKEKNFRNKKTLIIHSGGSSKRILQYSLSGKLFMPIQRTLPDGRPSSLFDEIFLSFLAMPSKIDNGIFILSSDVWLLFDYSEINIKGEKIVAISAKAESKKGENHGVFLVDKDKYLLKFLHKQSKEKLQEERSNRKKFS